MAKYTIEYHTTEMLGRFGVIYKDDVEVWRDKPWPDDGSAEQAGYEKLKELERDGVREMKCVHCDREITPDERDVYCHECYTSLNDEHDKVRAVKGSLEALEALQADIESWSDEDWSYDDIDDWHRRLGLIIDRNKEVWGL